MIAHDVVDEIRHALAAKLDADPQFEVRRVVVEPVAVSMVNALRREQSSPEDLFHDLSVLKHGLAVDADDSIALRADGAPLASGDGAARHGTVARGGRAPVLQLVPRDGLTALSAREFAGVLKRAIPVALTGTVLRDASHIGVEFHGLSAQDACHGCHDREYIMPRLVVPLYGERNT